ncbi:hypothetical protein ABVK25_007483 [Lepraria finkii]|uniref:Uncharacterized protein n=1 Tax=Lepraria finkii TaxID=1340010 RepID=A0ABR4B5Z6_9LECA
MYQNATDWRCQPKRYPYRSIRQKAPSPKLSSNSCTNSSGFRSLYGAIRERHWRAAEILLQHSANPSDVGNGMNPLRPETCRNVNSFYQSVIKLQSVLQEYATKSERQSRRNSITTEEDN